MLNFPAGGVFYEVIYYTFLVTWLTIREIKYIKICFYVGYISKTKIVLKLNFIINVIFDFNSYISMYSVSS